MKISVKVKPNSRIESIKEISENEFIVCVKEPAREGKANFKVIKLVAKKFGVSSKNVKIKNPSSRKKLVEIQKN